MAERSKAADCKSAGLCPTKVRILLSPPVLSLSGSNSVGRVTAFQAVGRGFESRLPLQIRPNCPRSSGVEHVLGKDGVTSSTLVEGSRQRRREIEN